MENRTLRKVLSIIIAVSFITTPAYASEKLSAGNVVSILKIDNINVNIYQNQNYKLPKELKAVYSDKRVRTVNVAWDVKSVDVSGLETNTYYGKVIGYNNVVKLTVKIMAPEVELKNIEGKSVKLSDYKGKIVIVNFWATWCKYCHQTTPILNELNNEFKIDNEVVILAINECEDNDIVKDYISQNNVNYTILLDKDGNAANSFGGINGYPTTIIINRDGTYNKTIIGTYNKEVLMDFIDKVK